MSTALQISDSFVSSDAMSIAVISPDELRRSAATSTLGECQNGTIREFITYPPALNDVSRVLGHDFDVVLIDLDSDPNYALDLVKNICANGLATAMVFSAQADPDLLVRCMRAGAREYLMLPFEPGEMDEALRRVLGLRSATRPEKSAGGKMFVFLSAKGGSGVTTLACNFAVSLAHESSRKTLLIDLNMPLGDAAINLGIKAQYSVVNALENASRLDVHFLSGLLAEHESGLFVLAASSELAPVQMPEDAIDRLLSVARQKFDYVVVDAGSRLDLQHSDLFEESATLYLVTQIGVPELRNSNRLISNFSREGSPKIEIIINRFDPHNLAIDEEHITKALTRPATWKIPNNYAAVRKMQRTATPLTEEDSQISRAIKRMTRSVCGKHPTEQKRSRFHLFR
jgi:pilus assembly protein CpaE